MKNMTWKLYKSLKKMLRNEVERKEQGCYKEEAAGTKVPDKGAKPEGPASRPFIISLFQVDKHFFSRIITTTQWK